MISSKYFYIGFFYLLVILLSRNLPAQSEQAYSLADAQDYAVKHNRDVRNAELGIEAANKQLWEVTATGFPQIEISANYTHMLDIPTQLIPGEIFGGEPGSTIPVKFGKPHLASYGVSISQLIFSGSYLVGLNASKIYLQLSEQNLTRTELEVKATVTNTYYLILIAEETRNIIIQTLENLRHTQYEINELNKEGFNEASDVKQIQISVNALENGLRSIEQQIDVSYKLLKFQMGLPLEESITLKEKLITILNQLDIKTPLALEFNVEDNIGFKAVNTRAKLADLSLKNEVTTFYPTFAAFANFQRDAQRDNFNIFDWNKKWYPTSLVGVQMSWPVFSGSSKIFRVQKARIELKQAKTELEKVRDGLKLEYRQAHSALAAARDRYNNARDNRDLALEVYDISLEKYREGLISSLELTQAQNQYLNAEQDYLQNVSDALTAYTQLRKILEIL
jgi:outer membrane protein TolC